MLKKIKIPHVDNPKLMHILKTQPEILKMFGYDPVVVQQQIDDAKAKFSEVEANYDEKMSGFGQIWTDWLVKYKGVLALQK